MPEHPETLIHRRTGPQSKLATEGNRRIECVIAPCTQVQFNYKLFGKAGRPHTVDKPKRRTHAIV